MLYYCGRTVVEEKSNVPGRNRRYIMNAIYDTQTNVLDFYTRKNLRRLVTFEQIKGLASVKVQPRDSFDFGATFFSPDQQGAYVACSRPFRSVSDDCDIYISSPVILGTLRKGMAFHYKNLRVQIQEPVRKEQSYKVVDVGLDFGKLIDNNKKGGITYQEFYNQVRELMTCFTVNNSKLLWWKITTPLTDIISTDCYLDLRIGKHKVQTMLALHIQGAKYLRYSVNDNTECYINSPTRTVEILDLRRNEERFNSYLLMDSKLDEILAYYGTILLSVKDESYISVVRNVFKTNAEVYYLGQFETLNDFYKCRTTRVASFALMNTNKKVFFIANIKERG